MHGLLQSECEQTVWALHRDAGQAANETDQRCRFNPVGQSIKKCSVLQAKCTAITNLPPKSKVKVAGPRVGIHVCMRRSRRPTGTQAALQRTDGALWRSGGPGRIHMLLIGFTSGNRDEHLEDDQAILRTRQQRQAARRVERSPDRQYGPALGTVAIGSASRRAERAVARGDGAHQERPVRLLS